MHEFSKYKAPTHQMAIDLVHRNPFAIISSSGSGEAASPTATHAPIILDPSLPLPDDLVGVTMLGHMARSNPHWRDFALRDHRVLMIFTGPHDYVSPTAYGYAPAVPTWDYAAVHLTARVELVDDAAGCLEIVKRTVTALESFEHTPWDMTESVHVFEQIVGGVVGFKLHIETQQALFKMSQDMPPDVRQRVGDASRSRGCPHGDIAPVIQQVATSTKIEAEQCSARTGPGEYES